MVVPEDPNQTPVDAPIVVDPEVDPNQDPAVPEFQAPAGFEKYLKTQIESANEGINKQLEESVAANRKLENELSFMKGRAETGGGMGQAPPSYSPKTEAEMNAVASGWNSGKPIMQAILASPDSYDVGIVRDAQSYMQVYGQVDQQAAQWRVGLDQQAKDQRERNDNFRFLGLELKLAQGSDEHELAKTLNGAGWDHQKIRDRVEQDRQMVQHLAGGTAKELTAQHQQAAGQIEPANNTGPRLTVDPAKVVTDEQAAARDYNSMQMGGLDSFMAPPAVQGGQRIS